MRVVNFVYDYDGTLTSNPIPQYKIIETCGYTIDSFNLYAASNKEKYGYYDGWYMTLIDTLKNNYDVIDDKLVSYGSDNVIYNNGVIDFLNNFKIENVDIKHYIVTSGIKVYIDNTKIAPYITYTYGTTFKYDNKNIIDIEEVSTSKKKIEHIKDINIKNNRDPYDCTDLIYFGDGMTDYDAFLFVKNHNGTSILVYNDSISDDLNDVINKSFKADYSDNSELVNYLRKMLD